MHLIIVIANKKYLIGHFSVEDSPEWFDDLFFIYSKSFNVVPFALPSRYRFWAFVNDRYRLSSKDTHRYLSVTLPLPTVPNRDRSLLVTVSNGNDE
jgi:hypothetical protein